jgi:hypothetical protein
VRTRHAATLMLLAFLLPRFVLAVDIYPITGDDRKFLTQIVDAVDRKDITWLASHMVYPLSVVTSNQTRVVKGKEEFKPILARELSESLRAKISGEANKPLFKNWQGVMVGGGVLWFSKYQHQADKSWKYGISSIGCFAFQPRDAAQPQEGR